MGLVRTKTVKKASRAIVEKHYARLTTDFQVNKKYIEEIAQIPSQKMRNKIAGFVTHLMRRIQRGDRVRGISLKLQEEERERRMEIVPEVSWVQEEIQKGLEVDENSFDMLKVIGFGKIDNVRALAPAFRGKH